MSKLTQVSLVALRIAIGWHFLYEGVWKIDSRAQDGQAYVATRFGLQTSTGRMRGYFQQVPPEGLKLDAALARIDQWHDEIGRVFTATNKPMTDEQKLRLAELRDNLKLAAAEALSGGGEGAAAEAVNIDWYALHDDILKIAEPEASAAFSSLEFLQGSAGPFRGLFRGLVADIDGLERLTPESARRRLDERYEETVRHCESAGYPLSSEQRARLAAVREALKATAAANLADPAFRGGIEHYQAMLARVREDEARAVTPFARERLDADRKKLGTIAGELLAFANEPVYELAVQAQGLATTEQMKAGPLPPLATQTAWIDFLVKWGLAAIGLCLVLGLFTPVAALAAAAQLAIFYLASPPLPGLPASTMGGHFLYVDRNLVELIAALVIATTATGRWAGLDYYLHKLIALRARQKSGDTPACAPPVPQLQHRAGVSPDFLPQG